MTYPLISEYVESILNAEDNFKELTHLRPVLNANGTPFMTGGNFAQIFKMQDTDTGKLYAVKCFLREQERREESYQRICEELAQVDSPYMVKVHYYEKELYVHTTASEETEFPMLLMDWVEGVSLDKYLRDNIDDVFELELLTWNFKQLAVWLLEQPFAHGDLKPDNIIVRNDGSLVLVDYDGMYVPAMQGEKARELGSPDFRHPNRTESEFDKHIDDFPIASILLSLKAIALKPELLDEYGARDRLLFSEADYRDLANCRFVKENFPSQSPELDMLYALSLFVWREMKQAANTVSAIMDAAVCQPEPIAEEDYSTEVTKEDRANAWVDKYGAKYSADRKRLLEGPDIEKYSIRKGTVVICFNAFGAAYAPYNSPYTCVKEIVIPDSVRKIGNYAFKGCSNLYSIVIPDSVRKIGNHAFEGCSNLYSIVIPDFIIEIGDEAFAGCCNLQTLTIPNSVKWIGLAAFKNCSSLESINIPQYLKFNEEEYIDVQADYSYEELLSYYFEGCVKLQRIEVSRANEYYCDIDGVLFTKDKTKILKFPQANPLKSYTIPNTVKIIGKCAFLGCANLEQVIIPNSVEIIEDRAFTKCLKLKELIIPDSVKSIGWRVFNYCDSLEKCIFHGSTPIEKLNFRGWKSLKSVKLPKLMSIINSYMFENCENLQHIELPDSIDFIGDGAFKNCINLQSIVLPFGLRWLGTHCKIVPEPDHDGVFENCSSLKSITIPTSVVEIGYHCFKGCTNLQSVTLPPVRKRLWEDTFDICKGDIFDFWGCTFENCPNIQSIYIPYGSKDYYADWIGHNFLLNGSSEQIERYKKMIIEQ